MRLVIDTNVLVSSLSRRSMFHWLIQNILDETVDVCLTDEILLEYEEILTEKYSQTVAHNFLAALKELPNVHFIQIYFRWQLLKDTDDNKFVDCAIAGNADYLVTHDNDFNLLKKTNFPKVSVINLPELQQILSK
ncbi:MAG: putative toxin-antitoxin system toxin component, PIN family [Bacteroidetes bacterium]|nr:putative toxin-antitoxin system toxin component, PIN family [Bacteroidota bacterium]